MEKPLAVLPQVASGDNTPKSDLNSTSAMDDSLISVLKEMRNDDASKSKVSRRKKLNVEPGKSVGLADFPSTQGCGSGSWKRKRWKRSFSVEAEAEARKIPPLPLPHRGKNGKRKEIGSAILRRRTNRGA